MGTLQQISALEVGQMWGRRLLNALLSGRMWGLRICSTEGRLGRSIVRSIDGKEAEECVSIVYCLSNRPSVKNLYVFVGISNLKILLCIYYCL